MNCEAVEELLSAYLDITLAPEDYNRVHAHVQQCTHCSAILADYRHFDALLTQLPRVSPEPSLREKIFASPEYRELTRTFDGSGIVETPTIPHKSFETDIAGDPGTPGRPRLIALPGGRISSANAPTKKMPTPAKPPTASTTLRFKKRRASWGQRAMHIVAAAAILLTMGVGGFITWRLWQEQAKTASDPSAITPPAALSSAPIPAGMRFVFLRDGALWSGSADTATSAIRLTPTNVTVAPNWAIRPPLAGRVAGDLLAYVDLQHGFIHTERSDGQSDTVIPQPLLKAGIQPASVWDTELGSDILSNLAWSKDGTTLAFVADPLGTGLPNLYLYSTVTGTVHMVTPPVKGEASHPVWSPDGVRIAFEFVHNGSVGIIDYNTQNHGILMLTDAVSTQQYPNDTLLSLDWSPNVDAPAVTWSVGTTGHVHSIWSKRIGFAQAQQLASGEYAQAIYSPANMGNWLLVAPQSDTSSELLRVALNATRGTLVHATQMSNVQWSPDGKTIDYLTMSSASVGTLHIVNSTSGVDTQLSTGVANDPMPIWSPDGQSLAYSTATHIFVVAIQRPDRPQQLRLQGPAFAFTWSMDTPHQLIIAVGDGQQGIYQIDAQHNIVTQLDKEATRGPIEWMQIP